MIYWKWFCDVHASLREESSTSLLLIRGSLVTLCLIGAILRFFFFFFLLFMTKLHVVYQLGMFPPLHFSQQLLTVSFSSSFSSSPSSLHILHNSSTSPFFSTKTSLFSRFLTSSDSPILSKLPHSLIFSLDSLHLF